MATYRIVMWSLAGAMVLLHAILFLRMRRRLLEAEGRGGIQGLDWTVLNSMAPLMFLTFSRPALPYARYGLGLAIGFVALYAVGILYLRLIRGVEWPKLSGFLIGAGEFAVLAAACAWGTHVLPAKTG